MVGEHRTYGIREVSVSGGPADDSAREIELAGYTVLEDVVPPSDLEGWCRRLDAIMERQQRDGGGAEAMAALGEAHTARALLAYDEAFIGLALSRPVLAICERLLGEYFVLNQQNGVVNPPAGTRHHQSAYHRDLPYQHFVSSRPLALSVLYCLDPFAFDNGGTLVLPGSHRIEAFPPPGVVARLERAITAPAGACLVFDSMLFHRAGKNLTNKPRRAVNHVWTLPILKQQIVLKDLLRPEVHADPQLRRLLGVDSEPARSVPEWIEHRRARAG